MLIPERASCLYAKYSLMCYRQIYIVWFNPYISFQQNVHKLAKLAILCGIWEYSLQKTFFAYCDVFLKYASYFLLWTTKHKENK